MTLREAFQGLLDLLLNSFASFVDAQEKLFSGNILDLTIGQTISLFFPPGNIFQSFVRKERPLLTRRQTPIRQTTRRQTTK